MGKSLIHLFNEVVTKYNLRSGVLTVVTVNNSVF